MTSDMTLTCDGQVVGTPAYMAPEQARGDSGNVDRLSDIYSLGVVLYELLTGEVPFRGTPQAILQQLQCDEPRSPRRLNPNISRDLETICLKCLEKEPRRRYATASNLAEDLRHLQRREPITARPVGHLECAWRYGRRHPARTGLMVAISVAAIALISVLVGYRHQQELLSVNSQLAKAQDDLQQVLYHRQIASAQSELSNNNAEQAAIHLTDTSPERRNWEWYYLNRSCHPERLALHGHSDVVCGVAYSPDGKHIASASADKTIKVWDSATGQEVLTIQGHRYFVCDVAYSPDGTRIVSGSLDKTVRVWDAATGRELLTLNGHTKPVNSVAYRSDGQQIVSGGYDNTLKVWDAKTGRELFTLDGHTAGVICVTFSPDSKHIASGSSDQTLKIWDAVTGQETFTFGGHAGPVSSVAYSPDSTRIVSGSDARKDLGRCHGAGSAHAAWPARRLGREVQPRRNTNCQQ